MEPLSRFSLTHFVVILLVFGLLDPSRSQEANDGVDVVEGKSTSLQCRFDPSLATRNPVYYWIRTNIKDKDNVALQERSLANNYKLEFDPDQGKYDLRINSATYDRDNGKFECKLKEGGSGNDLYAKTVKLTVLIPPKAPEIAPNNPTVTEGEKIDLVCSSLGGSPPPEIVWIRKGDSRPTSGVYKAGETRDVRTTSTLSFVPKREDDGAEFVCEVWNRALSPDKKLRTSIRLNVNYYPRFKLNPYNPILMEKGASETVTCEVDSKPPPTYVRWTRGDRILTNERTLTVKPQGLEDGGSYFCEASNGLGGEPKRTELVVDVLYGPIVSVENQREAEPGDSVAIRCNVTSNPPAAIVEWLKESDPYFRQEGEVLRFDSIKAEDSARYVCRAANIIRSSGSDKTLEMVANATTAILIKHKPGKAFVDPAQPIASDGDPFSMSCKADPPGWPEPTYKWWRDGSNVTLSLGQKYTLATAQMSNEGAYFCKASNILGDSTVASVVLRVYEPPRLITQLSPQATRRAGYQDFSINCSARGNPSPKVRWMKDGEELEANPRYVVSTQDNFEKNFHVVDSVLRFDGEQRHPNNQLSSDDRGQYTCQFENEVRQVATSMVLRIEHPPVVVHRHDKVATELRDSAVLVCRMQAYPEPQFKWLFNGNSLDDRSDKYEQNVTSLEDDVSMAVLKIHDIEATDFGRYECKATNNIDGTVAEIRLQATSPPEKPTDLEVVDVGYDYATIRWKEGFDGGFVNTTFSVHGNKSGATADNEAEERAWDCQLRNPCNITALEQQTSYVIHVQAHNFKGRSEFSDKINFTTRVNAEDIPQPFSVEFNKDTGRLDVRVRQTSIDLVGQIDVKSEGTWVPYADTVPVVDGRGSLQLQVSGNSVETVRVALCLRNNPHKCGAVQEASVSIVLASLTEPEIIGIAVGCAAFALILIVAAVLTCYCYRRNDKDKKMKKDYEMETSNVRPKVITPPTYRDGIVNKGADDSGDLDDPAKNGIYSTGSHLMNGHVPMSNGGGGGGGGGGGAGPGGYAYLDRDNGLVATNGGSIDSQDSLWIKSSSNLSSDRPYPYDPPPPMSHGYMYPPDDYHHMHEDVMNQRNRDVFVNGDPYAAVNKPKKRSMDHMESPYRDISGLPDPYLRTVEEEDDQNKPPPHMSLSFEESLESGYSTPNSRARRVIREIIV